MSLLKWGCVIVVIVAAYSALKSKRTLPVNVGGTHHPAFKPLADAFRKQIESGKERGGAFAVYHHGDLVFDMWGGYADVESRRPWQQDTMTMVYSVSKGIVSIVIASLAERGFIDYKRPVVDYWPQFGQNDKANITVEMLLSHQAGLAILDEHVNIREVRDNLTKVHKILAQQKTSWPAGSKLGYHMLTFGMYADALVQKVDPKGRTSAQVFLEDIAEPFGIDAFLNCPKEKFYRAAKIYSDSPFVNLFEAVFSSKYFGLFAGMLMNPDNNINKASVFKDFKEDFNIVNDPDVREVTMTSLSVTGTARGLAKLYGILANGGRLGSQSLLNKTTLATLSEPLRQAERCEITTLPDPTFGRGMWIGKNPKGQLSYGHPGHGGQLAYADPANNIGLGYITNYLSIYGTGDDPRVMDLMGTLYECAEKYDCLRQ